MSSITSEHSYTFELALARDGECYAMLPDDKLIYLVDGANELLAFDGGNS